MNLSLEELADQIIEFARKDHLEDALKLMHELPHDKFTMMTITSGEKRLKRIANEQLKRSEKRELRRSVQESILKEMGIGREK